MEPRDKKQYEIAFLSKDEQGAQEVLKAVKKLEGELIFEGPFEKTALTYKIKKQTTAFFGYVHATLKPESIKDLDHNLRINPDILRFLIVTPPFVKTKARPLYKPSPKTEPEPKEPRPKAAPIPLSNEALEKKIEEILKE